MDATSGTNWNPTTHDEHERLVGRDVYSSDGEQIGIIQQVLHPNVDMPEAKGGHYFLTRPNTLTGPLGEDEAYVPETAIRAVTDTVVELNVTQHEIPEQNWAREPVDLVRFQRG